MSNNQRLASVLRRLHQVQKDLHAEAHNEFEDIGRSDRLLALHDALVNVADTIRDIRQFEERYHV